MVNKKHNNKKKKQTKNMKSIKKSKVNNQIKRKITWKKNMIQPLYIFMYIYTLVELAISKFPR